ncbi:MAG: hypothetical protein Q4C01_00500 [Clostridia bacterium]|nr:hypothetical protein [Clostridia bacterium]
MKLRLSKKISLSAMIIALNVLFLYASEVVPFSRLIFAFLTSLFVYILVGERQFLFAWLSFLATAILAFLLLPDRMSWFFYVALIGHFGIVRQFFCDKVNIVWLRSILTVLYCNIGFALASFCLWQLTEVSILTMLPNVHIVLLVILAQICFFVLDLIYNLCIAFYNKRIRKWLVV